MSRNRHIEHTGIVDMDDIALQQRIDQGENLHTEFKLWPIHTNSLAETLVAFANTDGGQLILGVDDVGDFIGVENADATMHHVDADATMHHVDADATMHHVDNVAYNNCEPSLTVLQEVIHTSAGTNSNIPIVVVNISKGDQCPYRTNTGRYTIRTTSGRRPASRQELLRMFQAVESLYYDESPMSRTKLTDLDRTNVERFFEEAQGVTLEQSGLSLERVLLNWKLAHSVNGELQLTFAGTLFFAIRPQHFVPYAYITAVHLPGIDLACAPTDRKRIEGTVPRVLEDAMRFLNIHLPAPHKIQGMEKEST